MAGRKRRWSAIRSDLASWTRLLLEDTAIEGLPRNWLRWAAGVVADTRKVSTGTPVDNQVASHLCDAARDLRQGLRRNRRQVALLCNFPVARPIQPESPTRAGDVLAELLMS